MFKPSPCLARRLRLTTKQVNGGYYKGNRTGSMGYFGNKKGDYIIDWRKVRTYVAPKELDQFHLTPFVSKRVEPMRDEYAKPLVLQNGEVQPPKTADGKDFLERWSNENVDEVIQTIKAQRRDKKQTKKSPSGRRKNKKMTEGNKKPGGETQRRTEEGIAKDE